MAISPAALEGALSGVWAVHGTTRAVVGDARFRRRPTSHIAFDGPRWWLFQTASKRRFRSCGMSQGAWEVIIMNTSALLVLTVSAYRRSSLHQAAIESNHGYSGGALAVMGARALQEEESGRIRRGQAKMYFQPLELHDRSIVMALPSNGRSTPLQRWARAEVSLPPP